MPRQAHGRPLTSSGPSNTRKRKPAKGRGLDALETAERQFPDKIKIRQHRLGEAEDDDDETPQTRADTDGRSAKRRKIDPNGEEASTSDGGSDLDGERWHVGVEDDDEDSDIDSDEAFGESDEERFAGFTFRGSSTTAHGSKQPKKRVRLSGRTAQGENTDDSNDEQGMEEGDEDEDLGDDAIDLAAALDLNEEEERRTAEKSKKKNAEHKRSNTTSIPQGHDDSDETDSESQDEDNSDAYSGFSISEDDGDAATATRLQTFINGLTPAQQDDLKSKQSSRSRALPAKPSQYALPSTGLSAADLMQYVKDPAQRQSLKILQAAEKEEPMYHKNGIPGRLAAPLAKRQQDRLDRVAAYEHGKKTLERWVDTVKQNRRAEHVSFPLADAAKDSATNTKSFQPVSKSQPQSGLESKIQEIMQESGISTSREGNEEGDEQRYEELQEKKIPLDEVQERRRALRMQRELMFREEVRAKRIKKIKSKAFRRVHRKERDKFAVQERERLAAAGMLDSDEERDRNDKRRAEERMGARHRDSKWAKAAKATGQTTWNEDAKTGVSDLARRDEELRRRIEGKRIHDSDDSGSGSDSDSDSDGYSTADDERDRWKEKLDTLDVSPVVKGKSNLADMAFMKKAEAIRQAENDEEVRLLRRAVIGDGEEASDSGSDISDRAGRQKFGQTKSKTTKQAARAIERNEFEARLSEDEGIEDEIDDSQQVNTQALPSAKAIMTPVLSTVSDEVNGKTKGTRAPSSALKKLKGGSKAKVVNGTALDDYTSPSESEQGDQEDEVDEKSKLAMEIFAGDEEEDLKVQFEKEKKDTVEEEGDQIVDNTLPGWGSWTGAGISKREKQKGRNQLLSTIKGVAADKRKDAKLERVIVNEKKVKKNGRYLAPELPHPFESRQQYERALRLPVGPEWSTRSHYQDAIKPRVLLKQGQIVKPMAKPTA